ncbi:MAG TPA: alpha/beta hydrolase [Acidimicrobiia bacterium]|jgi:pimeloyl-ACP methyl ester carboxylesterase
MNIVAIALAAVVGLTAAARPTTPPSTRPPTTQALPTTAGTAWPPLPAFDTAIDWSDCGADWECGTLTVPVDWTAPTADTVPLALVRHRATSPGARVGTLVVNPGGPGDPGTSRLRAAYQRLPDVVKQRFDLVSWDPRGTGASRPVDCVDDQFLDLSALLPAVPDDAARLAAVRRYNRAFARGCVQRSGAYAGQVGTRSSARDLEAIRIALGEPSLNFLGFSYGSVLGATYAQMFPQYVRTMVLDGPPDVWLPSLEYARNQAAGFMNALNTFLDWCARDTSCALRDAGDPRDAFGALLGELTTSPMAGSYVANGQRVTGGLTPSLFETAVLSMLYDESRGWPILGRALRAAAVDHDPGALLQLADSYLVRNPDGTWDPLVEANAVISCVDRPDPKPRSAARELADVVQFQSQLPPWGGSWAVSSCAGMPEPARGDKLGDVRVAGTPPIVVIGTTHDPATPYPGAMAMVTRIAGSTLLTFDSTEHTAYGTQRSACIDDAVDAYFVDGTVPAPGTTCSAGV